MARLQAKFDHLFAATERYRTSLSEIEKAQRVGAIASTEDTKEGTTAFLEKRKATWKGR